MYALPPWMFISITITTIQLIECAIPLSVLVCLSQKIQKTFPQNEFLKHGQLDLSKDSDSISDYRTSTFPENFWISWNIVWVTWPERPKEEKSRGLCLSHLVDVFHLFHVLHVLHVTHVLQTYSMFSNSGLKDLTSSAALSDMLMK